MTSALLAIHGTDPVQLAQFGLSAPKDKRTRSAAEKAESAEKANATRKLKGQGDRTSTPGSTNGTSH